MATRLYHEVRENSDGSGESCGHHHRSRPTAVRCAEKFLRGVDAPNSAGWQHTTPADLVWAVATSGR